MREDKTNWFCSRVMDGEISYSLPLQQEQCWRQHTVPVVSKGKLRWQSGAAGQWQQSKSLQEELFVFSIHPDTSTSLQREIWAQSWQRSPGHRGGEGFWIMMRKPKLTISSFLITLALWVTCGQGWQVITHCVFHQIKQINLMGLSHILDFPVNGCDLPI